MKREQIALWKLVFGGAIGALIGTLFAMEFGMFWWVGTLIGACTAFILCDPISFAIRLKHSISETLGSRVWWKNLRVSFFRPTLLWFKYGLEIFIFCVGVGVFFFIAWIGIAIIFVLPYKDFSDLNFSAVPMFLGVIMSLSLLIGLVLSVGCTTDREKLLGAKAVIICNPISPPYLPILGLAYVFYKIPKWVPVVCKAIRIATIAGKDLVVETTLRLSQLLDAHARMVSAFGALTGSVTGYFFGSAVIGCMIGGLVTYVLAKLAGILVKLAERHGISQTT